MVLTHHCEIDSYYICGTYSTFDTHKQTHSQTHSSIQVNVKMSLSHNCIRINSYGNLTLLHRSLPVLWVLAVLCLCSHTRMEMLFNILFIVHCWSLWKKCFHCVRCTIFKTWLLKWKQWNDKFSNYVHKYLNSDVSFVSPHKFSYIFFAVICIAFTGTGRYHIYIQLSIDLWLKMVW